MSTTTSERLIRTICEQKRLEIEQQRRLDPVLKSGGMETPFRNLPREVQQAFRNIAKYEPLIKQAKKIIEEAGYDDDLENGGIPANIDRTYRSKQKTQEDAQAEYARRLNEVKLAQTNAQIECMGKTPAETHRLLKHLQTQLKDV